MERRPGSSRVICLTRQPGIGQSLFILRSMGSDASPSKHQRRPAQSTQTAGEPYKGLLGFTIFTRAWLCFTPCMDRSVLTDAQWAKMEPRCLGKPGDPGRSGKDNRLFVEAVLWIVRTGSPWRDLPPLFGNWNSVFTRF